MKYLADYSFHHPKPADIKAAGFSGAVRYVSGMSQNIGNKDIGTPEIKALHAAGLSITLVWETTAGRATKGGAAGAYDVAKAEQTARAFGYPLDCPIFYAVDRGDITPSRAKPYFDAIKARATYPVGVYGSHRIVEARLAPYLWQTSAWSNGIVYAPAHLYQRQRATLKIAGGGYDENIVLHPFPVWTNTTAPVAAPAAPIRPPTRPLVTHAILAVDGDFGPKTRKRFQQWAHVTQDGDLGYNTWHHVQVLVHVTPTGFPDHNTWVHLQRLIGTKQDGVFGPLSVKALQRYLNSH